MGHKAIFLDRDGTLNVDHGYVHQIDDFEFIPHTVATLRELQGMGFKLVMVTNQSGIARGYFSEQQFLQLTEWLDWSLAEQSVELDGIYYCPHHPEGKGEFRQQCDCRKPAAGMLLDAIKALDIDPAESYMVGDKFEDMQSGQAANVAHLILVETGKPITKQGKQLAETVLPSLSALPNYIRNNVNKS